MRFALVAAAASLGGLLFGYDTGVISGALLFLRDEFALSSTAQGVVTSSVLVGATCGAALGGPLTDRYGRRRVLVATAALFAAGSLASAAATGVVMLVAARTALGVAVGVASMLTPLYLSEAAPAARRGAAVSLNQLCVTLGILASYLVDYAFAGVPGTWRWMLGCGAVPGVLLGLGMLALPESPRWLAAQGRWDEAETVLRRLRGPDAADELAGLRGDVGAERGAAPLEALFKAGRARAPLVLGVALAVSQQVTGINTVIYYAPDILGRAGFASKSASILATAGIGTVNVLATVAALVLMDRVGRRPLLLGGLAVMALCLMALAGAFAAGGALGPLATVVLAGYVVGFAVGLGPVFWLLIAEIFPLTYRGRGMGVAAIANWASNLVVALAFPDLVRLLTPGGAFALFALATLAALAFAWRRVPETKDRSLERIEAEMLAAAG